MHPQGEESEPGKARTCCGQRTPTGSDHQPHSPAQLSSCHTPSPEHSWELSRLLQAVISGSTGIIILEIPFISLVLAPCFPDPIFSFLSVEHILRPTALSKQNTRLSLRLPSSFRSPRSAPPLKAEPHTWLQGHQDLL